ncbi:ABC-type glycerol-3-phosphate transport system substrate-binding protein [Fontibacillus phaseoli]|uniref:ABC-type glycerol-3-phosphate transport system substrate-binding protein n=1 Tax=Fontibacillus phaseoli TaxID=1416533 RepID=A0A369BD69_9BACL|nr:extracellular solute-binding protein [Fontibacillus phaseoli]RCX18536.1 ABC-type glycerol-3-phosphate transport system substrate-binding protein [Fontibacillus phaseoli]
MKRWILLLVVIILMQSGCKYRPEESNITLKVLYFDTDEFMTKYGNVFHTKFPNIDFEVIPLSEYYKEGLSEDILKQLIKSEQPDLIYVEESFFDAIISEGLLVSLDLYLNKSSDFKMEEINPHLLDYLRLKGQGEIYALTPTFSGKALFYNKTLFDQYGLDYPVDQMSWGDVFKSASMITNYAQNKSDIVGLFYDKNLFDMAVDMASSQGVRYVDPKGGKATINTSSWENILSPLLEGIKTGSLKTRENINQIEDSPEDFPFIFGKIAMTVDYSYLMEDLFKADFEWDMVTAPVDPAYTKSASAIMPNELFGIYSGSSKLEQSWKFIQYINGPEFANTYQMGDDYSVLLSRQGYNNHIDKNWESFYNIAPSDTPNNPLSAEQDQKIFKIANQKLWEAINNDANIKDLLSSMENEIQNIIGQ